MLFCIYFSLAIELFYSTSLYIYIIIPLLVISTFINHSRVLNQFVYTLSKVFVLMQKSVSLMNLAYFFCQLAFTLKHSFTSTIFFLQTKYIYFVSKSINTLFAKSNNRLWEKENLYDM